MPQPRRTPAQARTARHLQHEVHHIMATLAELQADLAAIKAGVEALLAKGSTPPLVSQADLDALDADAKAIAASLTPQA
jgi:hypothetical protein